ncbi:MAG: Teichoic acid translocation permease protein TagG [Phycisphaerae bacterium]|nr:Teichoic acid translocation permease protein TagG [Phycisphaerae bacterium]
MFRELFQYRELLFSLTLREIRVRYKQSLLGMAWAVFIPLSMMIIFTFVFTKALRVPELEKIGMPYAVFAYLGLLPWTFFSSSLTGAVSSLVANQGLVTKVYCPREAFPLSCVASSAFDFVIASGVLVGLIGYFHLFTDWDFVWHQTMWFVPVVLLVQVMFTVGLAMLLAMGNLFFRDVRYLFSVVIYLWMFLTSVIYPLRSQHDFYNVLINLNPMTPIISAYRACIVGGHWPMTGGFIYATVVAVVVCFGSWRFFHRTEPRFAEFI